MSKVDVYVRRGSWNADEKRAIVAESFTDGVTATARRHGLQTHQIYSWRRVLAERCGVSDFLKVEVSGPEGRSPLPVPFSSPVGGPVSAGRLSVGHVEIGLPGGVTMHVPVSAGPAFVVDVAVSLSRGLS